MAPYNLIFTTGGTGFSLRDLTPEATAAFLDCECKSLMVQVSNECAKHQPLTPLSRGIAGICEVALLSNLPGTPTGATEIVEMIISFAVYAIQDLYRIKCDHGGWTTINFSDFNFHIDNVSKLSFYFKHTFT